MECWSSGVSERSRTPALQYSITAINRCSTLQKFDTPMLQIFLKLNRDVPIRRGHPWIFSGAIERCRRRRSSRRRRRYLRQQEKLARAAGFTIPSRNCACACSPGKKRPSIKVFLPAACPKRSPFAPSNWARPTNAYRLINGEGDFLAGADRRPLCRLFCLPIFYRRHGIFSKKISSPRCRSLSRHQGIFERSEGRVREEEGTRSCGRHASRRAAAGAHRHSRRTAINSWST